MVPSTEASDFSELKMEMKRLNGENMFDLMAQSWPSLLSQRRRYLRSTRDVDHSRQQCNGRRTWSLAIPYHRPAAEMMA